jgi:hypothetical protein
MKFPQLVAESPSWSHAVDVARLKAQQTGMRHRVEISRGAPHKAFIYNLWQRFPAASPPFPRRKGSW